MCDRFNVYSEKRANGWKKNIHFAMTQMRLDFFFTYAIKESKESPAQFVSSVYILYNN